MRVRLLATSMAIAVTLSSSASAQIFDTDFGAMILNQNIGAINTYSTQIDRINSERDADSRRNGRQQSTQSPNAPIPAATMEQLKSAVIDVLDPEYGAVWQPMDRRIHRMGKHYFEECRRTGWVTDTGISSPRAFQRTKGGR